MSLWTPAQLNQSVLIWMDPNVGATSSGGLVTGVQNQGQLGGGFAPLKTSQAHTLATNVQNGLSTLQASSAKRLVQASCARPAGPIYTFVVARNTNTDGQNLYPAISGVNGEQDSPAAGYISLSRLDTGAGNTGDNDWYVEGFDASGNPTQLAYFTSLGATTDAAFHVLGSVIAGTTNGSPQLWEDGKSCSHDSSVASYEISTATEVPAVTATMAIGTLDGTSNSAEPWYGDIGEHLTYYGVLADADRQRIEGYLAWRWGLQGNLDASHPYAAAPPMLALATVGTSGGDPTGRSPGGGEIASPITSAFASAKSKKTLGGALSSEGATLRTPAPIVGAFGALGARLLGAAPSAGLSTKKSTASATASAQASGSTYVTVAGATKKLAASSIAAVTIPTAMVSTAAVTKKTASASIAFSGEATSAAGAIKKIVANATLQCAVPCAGTASTKKAVANTAAQQGVTLWTPNLASSAALIEWWRADQFVNSGTPAEGDPVSNWASLVGSSNQTASVVSLQPSWTANGINGLPSISFSGSDGMAGDSAAKKMSNALVGVTYASVFQTSNPGGGEQDVQVTAFTNNSTVRYIQAINAGKMFYGGRRVNGESAAYPVGTHAILANTPYLSVGINNYATKQAIGRLNGVQDASGTFASAGVGEASDAKTDSMGYAYQSGSGGNFLNGLISERVVYDHVLSSDPVNGGDLERLEGYLAWRYNLQTQLPSSHPFYASPPTVLASVPWTPAILAQEACAYTWFDASDVTNSTLNANDQYTGLTNKFANAYSSLYTFGSQCPGQATLDGRQAMMGLNSSNTSPYTYGDTLSSGYVGMCFIYLDQCSSAANSRMISVGGNGDYNSTTGFDLNLQANASGRMGLDQNGVYISTAGKRSSCQLVTSTISSTQLFVSLNGASSTNGGTTYATSPPTGTPNINLSGINLLGRSSGSSSAALMGEIVFFIAPPTADELARTEGYLAWKWGTQGYLPSTHPYASAAPAIDTLGVSSQTNKSTASGQAFSTNGSGLLLTGVAASKKTTATLQSYVAQSSALVSTPASGGMGWTFCKAASVSPQTGAGSNYDILLTVFAGAGTDSGNTVYLNSESNSDYSDLRFTADDQSTLLNYWIESSTPTSAQVWVQVTASLETTAQTIYVFYGNSSATSTSNGVATFPVFDDFSGSSLDTSKWSLVSPDATATVSGGYLNTQGNQDPSKLVAYTAPTDTNYAMRARFQALSGSNSDGRLGVGIATTNSSPAQGYNLVLYNFSAQNQTRLLNDNVAWFEIDNSAWSLNTWYAAEIWYDGSTVYGQFDHENFIHSGQSGTRSGYPALDLGSFGATAIFDYAFVHKRLNTQPAVASWTAEQNLSGLGNSTSLVGATKKVTASGTAIYYLAESIAAVTKKIYATSEPTLWAPLLLGSNLSFYLDANSGVTLGSSSDVASWSDGSSHAYTASQSTVANRPTFIPPGSSYIGTGPALRTSATKSSQGMPGIPSQLDGFSVIEINGSSSTYGFTIDQSSDGNSNVAGPSSIVAGSPAFWSIVCDSSARTASFYCNGSFVGQTSSALVTKNASIFFLIYPVTAVSESRLYDSSSGSGFLFNRPAGARTFDGDTGTFLGMGTAAPDAVRQQIEGWALWQWGLQSCLPTSHPAFYGAPNADGTYGQTSSAQMLSGENASASAATKKSTASCNLSFNSLSTATVNGATSKTVASGSTVYSLAVRATATTNRASCGIQAAEGTSLVTTGASHKTSATGSANYYTSTSGAAVTKKLQGGASIIYTVTSSGMVMTRKSSGSANVQEGTASSALGATKKTIGGAAVTYTVTSSLAALTHKMSAQASISYALALSASAFTKKSTGSAAMSSSIVSANAHSKKLTVLISASSGETLSEGAYTKKGAAAGATAMGASALVSSVAKKSQASAVAGEGASLSATTTTRKATTNGLISSGEKLSGSASIKKTSAASQVYMAEILSATSTTRKVSSSVNTVAASGTGAAAYSKKLTASGLVMMGEGAQTSAQTRKSLAASSVASGETCFGAALTKRVFGTDMAAVGESETTSGATRKTTASATLQYSTGMSAFGATNKASGSALMESGSSMNANVTSKKMFATCTISVSQIVTVFAYVRKSTASSNLSSTTAALGIASTKKIAGSAMVSSGERLNGAAFAKKATATGMVGEGGYANVAAAVKKATASVSVFKVVLLSGAGSSKRSTATSTMLLGEALYDLAGTRKLGAQAALGSGARLTQSGSTKKMQAAVTTLSFVTTAASANTHKLSASATDFEGAMLIANAFAKRLQGSAATSYSVGLSVSPGTKKIVAAVAAGAGATLLEVAKTKSLSASSHMDSGDALVGWASTKKSAAVASAQHSTAGQVTAYTKKLLAALINEEGETLSITSTSRKTFASVYLDEGILVAAAGATKKLVAAMSDNVTQFVRADAATKKPTSVVVLCSGNNISSIALSKKITSEGSVLCGESLQLQASTHKVLSSSATNYKQSVVINAYTNKTLGSAALYLPRRDISGCAFASKVICRAEILAPEQALSRTNILNSASSTSSFFEIGDRSVLVGTPPNSADEGTISIQDTQVSVFRNGGWDALKHQDVPLAVEIIPDGVTKTSSADLIVLGVGAEVILVSAYEGKRVFVNVTSTGTIFSPAGIDDVLITTLMNSRELIFSGGIWRSIG